MAVPTVERPPKGLDATWTHVWHALVAEMKRVETWRPALWPFAVEYLHALRLSQAHRELAECSPAETNRESGLTHMHAAFAESRAQGKRAMDLADLLGLTPRARKALAVKVEESVSERPAVFDQLEAQRKRHAA